MQSLTTFFHMGGYAAYVWSAYGIVCVVLSLNVILSRRELANRIRRVRQLSQARQSENNDISVERSGGEVPK